MRQLITAILFTLFISGPLCLLVVHSCPTLYGVVLLVPFVVGILFIHLMLIRIAVWEILIATLLVLFTKLFVNPINLYGIIEMEA